jgi:hypothetical protein
MEKFIAIRDLAVQLNASRLLANSIDSHGIAAQSGAYGHIVEALKETLAHLVGRNGAESAYQMLLDGSEVEDIL